MPRYHVPIVDDEGRQVGHATVMRDRAPCSTPGCTGDGTILCDFPVKREGVAGTCDRRTCRACAVRGPGKNVDFCPPHSRIAKGEPARWKAAIERSPEPPLRITASERAFLEQHIEHVHVGDGATVKAEGPFVTMKTGIPFPDGEHAAVLHLDAATAKRVQQGIRHTSVSFSSTVTREQAPGFFDETPDERLLARLFDEAGNGSEKGRLTPGEQRAFNSMQVRSELTPRQRAYAELVLRELRQNTLDRELLERAIDKAEERELDGPHGAFEDMRKRIGERYPLTEGQRDYAGRIAEGD